MKIFVYTFFKIILKIIMRISDPSKAEMSHVFLKSKVNVIRLMLASAATDTELLHASFFSPVKVCLGRDCNILR